MPQRKRAILLAVAVASWLTGAAPLYADKIRGRIVRQGSSGDYPVGGIGVRVRQGTSGPFSSTVYTGQDGMYYLYRIPEGRYTLYVYGSPNNQPLTFAIQVSNQSWTDLAPIRLR